MIHTASLIHDDVLDESDMRRGKETVHQLYGTRVAVLAGDFMFAQSSWYLANLENLEVIKLISQVNWPQCENFHLISKDLATYIIISIQYKNKNKRVTRKL